MGIEQNMRSSEPHIPNPIMQKMKIKKMFKTFDIDKNKSISLDEFVGVVISQPELLGTAANLRRYFVLADTNHDGLIDEAELVQFLGKFLHDRFIWVDASMKAE